MKKLINRVLLMSSLLILLIGCVKSKGTGYFSDKLLERRGFPGIQLEEGIIDGKYKEYRTYSSFEGNIDSSERFEEYCLNIYRIIGSYDNLTYYGYKTYFDFNIKYFKDGEEPKPLWKDDNSISYAFIYNTDGIEEYRNKSRIKYPHLIELYYSKKGFANSNGVNFEVLIYYSFPECYIDTK